jgi:hypothetical protein
MPDLLLLIILILWTGRITRFIWLDDLLKGSRTALKGWLHLGHIPDDIVGKPGMEDWLNDYHNNHPRREFLRRKAFDLIDCAWCISIWVAGFTILGLWVFTDVSMPLPLLWWPALSMGAVLLMQWTDGTFHVEVTQKK